MTTNAITAEIDSILSVNNDIAYLWWQTENIPTNEDLLLRMFGTRCLLIRTVFGNTILLEGEDKFLKFYSYLLNSRQWNKSVQSKIKSQKED